MTIDAINATRHYRYWLRAQVAYDIEMAQKKHGEELAKIHPWQPSENAACKIS